MKHAFTIDVEDFFQVAALTKAFPYDGWHNVQTRVEANTDKVLALCEAHQVIGTFFVLGWVAERYPQIVKKITQAGHEIASHGYSHQLVYSQTPEVFREETFKSKQILEDITGEPVLGYRAASYSITRDSLWALDTLIEAGFKWDSSIFPVTHDRYGIADSPKTPHLLQAPSGQTLVEFPLTSWQVGPLAVPIAGGGYFRLYPYWLTKFGLSQASKQLDSPFVFYLHPWEVDPSQPRVDSVSWFSKFRHYNNLDQTEVRLRALMQDFDFTTMTQVLDSLDLVGDIAKQQTVKISYAA